MMRLGSVKSEATQFLQFAVALAFRGSAVSNLKQRSSFSLPLHSPFNIFA